MPHDRRARLALILLAAVAGLLVLGFMTLGARGNWDFVLPFRGRKLWVWCWSPMPSPVRPCCFRP